MLLEAVDTGRVKAQFPRSRVVVADGADRVRHVVVVGLADPGREPALEAEGLRQAVLRGDGLPENLRVLVDAGAVGIEACQHRVTARSAEREGTVGAVEAHAARGEPVEVRGTGDRVAVAAEKVVQVVGDQEEDVLPFGSGAEGGNGEDGQQERKARGVSHRGRGVGNSHPSRDAEASPEATRSRGKTRAVRAAQGLIVTLRMMIGVTGLLRAPSIPGFIGSSAMASTTSKPRTTLAKITYAGGRR